MATAVLRARFYACVSLSECVCVRVYERESLYRNGECIFGLVLIATE